MCTVGLSKELKVLTLGATVLPVEVEKERQKNGMGEGKEPCGLGWNTSYQ